MNRFHHMDFRFTFFHFETQTVSSRVGCSITTSEPEQQQGNDLQSDTPTIHDGRKGAEIKGATSPKGRKAVQLGSAGSYSPLMKRK